MTDDEELDGGGEVSELDEEPRHHCGPLSAAGLLHNSHGVLRVVEFIQEEPHRGVVVPGRLVGHHCLSGDVGEEAAYLGPVLQFEVEVSHLVVVLGGLVQQSGLTQLFHLLQDLGTVPGHGPAAQPLPRPAGGQAVLLHTEARGESHAADAGHAVQSPLVVLKEYDQKDLIYIRK